MLKRESAENWAEHMVYIGFLRGKGSFQGNWRLEGLCGPILGQAQGLVGCFLFSYRADPGYSPALGLENSFTAFPAS